MKKHTSSSGVFISNPISAIGSHHKIPAFAKLGGPMGTKILTLHICIVPCCCREAQEKGSHLRNNMKCEILQGWSKG